MKVTAHRLGELCTFVRGTSATLKTSPGPFPLVVTAEFRRSSDIWQLEGPAVCIPLVSSTGHGDAALHRVHYQEGKFALANLLVALQPIDPGVCHAKYLYHLLMAKKDELLVPLMLGTANVSLKVQDIEKVEIPLPSVARLGQSAFEQCTNLSSVLFQGPAPTLSGSYVFSGTPATIYYLPGTTVWGDTFGGRPTLCWNPAVQQDDGFGFTDDRFGFNIAGTTNIPVVVEASTNLSDGVWIPLTNATLGIAGSLRFTDPSSTNHPVRFYRIVFP